MLSFFFFFFSSWAVIRLYGRALHKLVNVNSSDVFLSCEYSVYFSHANML